MMPQRPLVPAFVQVDALRGLAAIIVVIHHITTVFPGALGPFARPLQAIGDFNVHAVMLFFVISGFCIRASLNRNPIRDLDSLKTYLLRRVLRIVPPYWTALGVTFILGYSSLGDDAFQLRNLLGNLLFLQTSASAPGNWFPPYGHNGPLWSISYEVFYYLIFPISALAALKISHASQVSGLAAATLFSLFAVAAGAIHPNPILSFSSLYVVWRGGMSAYECKVRPELKRRTLVTLVGTISLLGVLVLVRPSATATLILIGLIIVTIWILVQGQTGKLVFCSSRSLILRLAARVGSISYCLYLFHYPVFTFISSYFGQAVLPLFSALLLVFFLSFLMEHSFALLKDSVLRFQSRDKPAF